jgi:hypothetical protein
LCCAVLCCAVLRCAGLRWWLLEQLVSLFEPPCDDAQAVERGNRQIQSFGIGAQHSGVLDHRWQGGSHIAQEVERLFAALSHPDGVIQVWFRVACGILRWIKPQGSAAKEISEKLKKLSASDSQQTDNLGQQARLGKSASQKPPFLHSQSLLDFHDAVQEHLAPARQFIDSLARRARPTDRAQFW